MVEVYGLSQLKKTTKKVARNNDCLVSEIFDTTNWKHQDWIAPLAQNAFYRGKEEYQFCAGTEEDFDEWRRSLCFLVHEKELEEVTETRTQNPDQKLYPLLSCSSDTTIFGPDICKRLYRELVEEWPKIIQAQSDDIEELLVFTQLYQQWCKCIYLGSQDGCVELF